MLLKITLRSNHIHASSLCKRLYRVTGSLSLEIACRPCNAMWELPRLLVPPRLVSLRHGRAPRYCKRGKNAHLHGAKNDISRSPSARQFGVSAGTGAPAGLNQRLNAATFEKVVSTGKHFCACYKSALLCRSFMNLWSLRYVSSWFTCICITRQLSEWNVVPLVLGVQHINLLQIQHIDNPIPCRASSLPHDFCASVGLTGRI